jgi:hypothetical protein
MRDWERYQLDHKSDGRRSQLNATGRLISQNIFCNPNGLFTYQGTSQCGLNITFENKGNEIFPHANPHIFSV